MQIVERAITRWELYSASEVFVTGIAIEICPVPSAEGVQVGDGVRGALLKTTRKRYAELARVHCKTTGGWLTAVETGQDGMRG